MPDVVDFAQKVRRICALNSGDDRPAPEGRTALALWLGVAKNYFSSRYNHPVTYLTQLQERAVVMALGFGPSDEEFANRPNPWRGWVNRWAELWRDGETAELIAHMEQLDDWFVPRPPGDPLLLQYSSRLRGRRRAVEEAAETAADERYYLTTRRRDAPYLDRLASLKVVHAPGGGDRRRLLATCTFGRVDVPTGDADYLVSINRCHAEIFLDSGSFEPAFEELTVDSRAPAGRKMLVEREYSRLNHPSWLLSDPAPRTPLKGVYAGIDLGWVKGQLSGEDEAGLIITKAGFAVSARSGPSLEDGGILNSLLKYLVTEHVGEIEQRSGHLYRMSPGPILAEDEDD